MTTDCRSIAFSSDFSIMAITGTNLFQVYAMGIIGEYQNFYTFPSQFGLIYYNKFISITDDGNKVVIVSTVGVTAGHYYFTYNRTLNEYMYRRFEASNANSAFFSKDGSLLYIITSNRLIVYK